MIFSGFYYLFRQHTFLLFSTTVKKIAYAFTESVVDRDNYEKRRKLNSLKYEGVSLRDGVEYLAASASAVAVSIILAVCIR